jgi:hypothetical protein
VTIYPDLAEEDALTAWPDGDEPDQNSLVTPRPYDVCSLTMELFQAGGEPGNTRGCWVIKMVMVHGRLKLELQEDTKVVPIVKWCVSTSNKGSELFVTLRKKDIGQADWLILERCLSRGSPGSFFALSCKRFIFGT